MNLSYLFHLFLNQFSPFAAFLAISSFLYVALGKSKMFHFHPIPRLILSVTLSLYTANSLAFDFARIISTAGTVVTIGLIGILIWHVALQRGKTIQQSFGVIGTAASTVSKYQEKRPPASIIVVRPAKTEPIWVQICGGAGELYCIDAIGHREKKLKMRRFDFCQLQVVVRDVEEISHHTALNLQEVNAIHFLLAGRTSHDEWILLFPFDVLDCYPP